jgi:hypothetical protein
MALDAWMLIVLLVLTLASLFYPEGLERLR